MTLRSTAALLFVGALAMHVHAAEPVLAKVQYNRDVRPILAENCFACHGKDVAARKAKLRLDDRAAAIERGAINLDKPNDSEVLARIFLKDDDEELMPPASSHKKLNPEQKAILKRWILEGAEYQPHWAFIAPVKPAVPMNATQPIDAFVNRQLADMKLTANGEADRPTLIRRVAFALTGLPPTLKEVDTFLADQKAGAYERMVDRYLASPQYGESMARHWLDLARYGDTHGLHLDNERGIWPYRDWVVKAFNDNKRFDAFTVEQLAGDLLPNPTQEQLVATGFNRCNVSTGEGGAIVAEWDYRYAVDRAAVASETWLGLTSGCAQCHDHKFDPISQKEFYSLYAFFYSAAGSPMDRNTLLHEPFIKLSTPEQDRKLMAYDRRLRSLNESIAAATAKYVDPALLGALIGGGAGPGANDPALSFAVWIRMRGGAEASKLPKEIKTIFAALTRPEQNPNAAQLKQLQAYFLRFVCPVTDAVLEPLMKAQEALTAERAAFEKTIPASMIFRDAPKPRQAFVMLRGQYDKPGEKVEPNTPAAFPALKTKSRATRLDLANWIVSPENPLTARVYVNRLWQQFFGYGLVKTGNDFGLQGDLPTHPELLDWLAVEFHRSGWDIRAMVRTMVTSEAFKRSSKTTGVMLQADPDNRFFARGPRFRLDAEQVRDNVLALGGLLDLTMGGKGVKPYQPDNIWEPVAYVDSNTKIYKRDSGSALYRRTLYTFYKRTAPPPYMSNFDAPNREQSCSRRDRSNTPLQALQLLNDIQHVEAARTFAERIVTEGGATATERLMFAFRMVLARTPTDAELKLVTDELTIHLARYAKAPDDAKKLIALGEAKAKPGLKPDEVAAYTLVASMLLNLDETLTRN